MADRLLVDLGADGQAAVVSWPDGGLPEERSRAAWAWPLTGESLGDLRWYLEDYLLTPFAVWEDTGSGSAEQLAGWGHAGVRVGVRDQASTGRLPAAGGAPR